MNENELSYVIRGAIFKVYNSLGPGLLESVYELTLSHELIKSGLTVLCQVPLPVIYDGLKLEGGYRIDILVNNLVIIEIKSTENLAEVHHKQVLTYLKLSGLKLGLLINFNSDDIGKSIFRKVNGLNFFSLIFYSANICVFRGRLFPPGLSLYFSAHICVICVVCGQHFFPLMSQIAADFFYYSALICVICGLLFLPQMTGIAADFFASLRYLRCLRATFFSPADVADCR